jgi:hypothetical protein
MIVKKTYTGHRHPMVIALILSSDATFSKNVRNTDREVGSEAGWHQKNARKQLA